MPEVIIVGSGIVGLAHALAAIAKGWRVSVFEKDGMPRGASVRNFGAIWPIAQPAGPLRKRALYGAARWKWLSKQAGFAFRKRGSIHLAYSDDAWKVLLEFLALQEEPNDSISLLTPDELAENYPQISQAGLRGGLFSTSEATIQPNEAIQALVKWLAEKGVMFYFDSPVVRVDDHEIQTSHGRRFRFDKLLICSGDEIRLLYPDALRAAGVQRVKLQMLTTMPQPPSWQLPPILASELTLAHYASFKSCPSATELSDRLTREFPSFQDYGIHVLAVQRPSGELVIGDSHEYGLDFEYEYKTEIEHLILSYLERFLAVECLQIRDRWSGYYLKSLHGKTEVILQPHEDVQIVTGLGGAGMTLSFGLAEQVVSGWEHKTGDPEYAPIN